MEEVRALARTAQKRRNRWTSVEIYSTHELADAVRAQVVHEGYANAKALAPEPTFLGYSLMMVSIDNLLRDLGKYTTPPHLATKPFHAASQLAWLRYRWAFQVVRRSLLPTIAAMALPHHHATVFSEHLGITFGLDAAKKALARRHPGSSITFYDVDFAVDGWYKGLPPIDVGRNRPDYLARVVSAGVVMFYVVECKGRRYNGPAAMHKQMAKGAQQVQALTVGGKTLPSLIVATTANASGITVAILDPDDVGVSYELPERVESAGALMSSDSGDVDLELFARRMEAVAVADVLMEGGDFELAGEFLQRPVSGNRLGVVSSTLDGFENIGQIVRFPLLGGTMNAFRGVARESLERARVGVSAPLFKSLDRSSADGDQRFEVQQDGVLSDTEDLVADHDDAGFLVASWMDE